MPRSIFWRGIGKSLAGKNAKSGKDSAPRKERRDQALSQGKSRRTSNVPRCSGRKIKYEGTKPMKSAQYKAARRCSPVADADKTMGIAHDQALSNVDCRLRGSCGRDLPC